MTCTADLLPPRPGIRRELARTLTDLQQAGAQAPADDPVRRASARMAEKTQGDHQ